MTQRKSRSKTAEVRTIKQYCSVCKKTFDMPVVEESENQDVIWLSCPGCKGFLPYMKDREEFMREEGSGGGSGSADIDEDIAPEDIDKENAKEYFETDEYNIGDIIYHRSWNDYGKVMSKETLPGNRKTILVKFINQGKIRLIEGVTS